MVDVLVATGRDKLPAGLCHCPWPIRIHCDIGEGWAAAANRLLDLAAESGQDVLFLDDDITLHSDSFVPLLKHYEQAEVFGFRLRLPGGSASAGWELPTKDSLMVAPTQRSVPCYLAHVTTSCIFMKAVVVQSGVRFPIWEGAWYEDVAFTVDCWLKGHRVAYVGGDVDHEVGATKLQHPDGYKHNKLNFDALQQWMQDADIPSNSSENVTPGKVLVGAVPLEESG